MVYVKDILYIDKC